MNRKVLVTGDLVLDHHIYEGQRYHYGERTEGVREIDQWGGAALVQSLLDKLLQNSPHFSVDLAADLRTDGDDRLTDDVPNSSQSYAFWRATPRYAGTRDLVWRSSEAMGFGGKARQTRDVSWPPLKPAADSTDVVVISDGGAGFRDASPRWPTSALHSCRWIILKTAAPFMEGALWNEMMRPEFANKLVIIASASQLRKSPARLGAGLSWEDTLESLAGELRAGGALQGLLACRHLVVSFESEGALWIEREDAAAPADQATAHLVYRPARIEGEQIAETDGSVFGLLSCLTAAVTWRLLIPSDEMAPDLEAGLESGLAAMHDLVDRGHGPATCSASGFPAARLAGVMQEITCRYARAILPLRDITSPAGETGGTPAFSLFRESLRTSGYGPGQPAYDLARLVVRHGMIALESLPHLRAGALISIDREEIESLRMLTGLMTAYRERPGADKPLSIGVFGPPGSGKSFTVKQLARAVLGRSGWLEFNLSQFAGPQDLIGAFHQVRDAVLEGTLPVAFFDEFDSQRYQWLQYLLAPMQDGRFQEGQITHPVGKCIFIFAGATSHSFETFGPSPDDKEAWDPFRFAKGPDFKSRLDGFLNVAGPNPQSSPSAGSTANAGQDVFFPVRRAFLLRGLLGCGPGEGLDINEGLLNALLKVPEYRHGSRSLSKVVEPLKVAAPGPLYRSLVPPRGRLALHTDAEAFLDLCAQADREEAPRDVLSEEQIDVMAAAIHQTWSGLVTKAGEDRPDARKVLDELSEFRRASNLASARRMIEILDMVNLALEPGSFDSPGDREWVRRKLEYHLELLAEAEHKGWMQWHIDRDWVYGRERNDEAKIHDCLLPYSRLSEHQKNKDRNSIRHYVQFAEVAGMRIAPAKELPPRPSP